MIVCVLCVQCAIFGVMMFNQKYRYMNTLVAQKAIERLSLGIVCEDKWIILKAYELVENECFSWDRVPDSYYEKWEKLVDKANDILNERKAK